MIWFLIRLTSPLWWLYGVFYVGFELMPDSWFQNLFAAWWYVPTMITLAASSGVPIVLVTTLGEPRDDFEP